MVREGGSVSGKWEKGEFVRVSVVERGVCVMENVTSWKILEVHCRRLAPNK